MFGDLVRFSSDEVSSAFGGYNKKTEHCALKSGSYFSFVNISFDSFYIGATSREPDSVCEVSSLRAMVD